VGGLYFPPTSVMIPQPFFPADLHFGSTRSA
jgi:hypothetical protein